MDTKYLEELGMLAGGSAYPRLKDRSVTEVDAIFNEIAEILGNPPVDPYSGNREITVKALPGFEFSGKELTAWLFACIDLLSHGGFRKKEVENLWPGTFIEQAERYYLIGKITSGGAGGLFGALEGKDGSRTGASGHLPLLAPTEGELEKLQHPFAGPRKGIREGELKRVLGRKAAGAARLSDEDLIPLTGGPAAVGAGDGDDGEGGRC